MSENKKGLVAMYCTADDGSINQDWWLSIIIALCCFGLPIGFLCLDGSLNYWYEKLFAAETAGFTDRLFFFILFIVSPLLGQFHVRCSLYVLKHRKK